MAVGEYTSIHGDRLGIGSRGELVVDGRVLDLAATAAIVALTNNTAATANDTVENVPAATAASTDTSAASLTSTNAAITAIENNISDLTAKVNAILAALAS